jgi:hypothetical protein
LRTAGRSQKKGQKHKTQYDRLFEKRVTTKQHSKEKIAALRAAFFVDDFLMKYRRIGIHRYLHKDRLSPLGAGKELRHKHSDANTQSNLLFRSSLRRNGGKPGNVP